MSIKTREEIQRELDDSIVFVAAKVRTAGLLGGEVNALAQATKTLAEAIVIMELGRAG